MVLKIVASGFRGPYAQLASELAMSTSEVHASVKRAQSAKLIHGPELQNRPNLAALEEFLVHGLKYAFPAERGEFTRGVSTSYAAEPLRDVIGQGNEPIPVWPYPQGKGARHRIRAAVQDRASRCDTRPCILRIPGSGRRAPGRSCARAKVRRTGTSSSFSEGKCAIRILTSSLPQPTLFARCCRNWCLSEVA